jgi:hypothetical protein
VRVARASRKHPILLEMLADGRLHVSGLAVLVRHLTVDNRDSLLARAVHRSKRQIEKLVADLHPRPDVPSVVRKLPERVVTPICPEPPVQEAPGIPAGMPSSPTLGAPRPVEVPIRLIEPLRVIEPLSPSRYRVQFTAGEELHDNLERLRGLLRSEIPDGDIAAIVGKAVRELRQRLEARRFGQTKSPRATSRTASPTHSSRYIPIDVRRAVYRRDQSRCRFTDAQGRRCPERHDLEYHHRHPFGRGGGPDLDNICLMCGPHNRYIAELDYGNDVISRRRNERPGKGCAEDASGEPPDEAFPAGDGDARP